MSERDRYPPGVPCWVETLQRDVPAALTFYGGLFGWEFDGPGPMPGDPPGAYYVARLGGRDVAGIGSMPARNGPSAPGWFTHVRVDRADRTAERVRGAGGSVLAGPFDVPPAGRIAVIVDPGDASVCVWEAGTREGAQRINEPGAWAMSSLFTRDLAGAKTFYGDVFGWQTQAFGNDVTLFCLPGYVGGEPAQPVPRDVVAVMMRAPDETPVPVPPHWSTDFWIADADGAASTALALGGRVIVPPHDAAMFKRAVLADPQGAVFTVSQLLRPHG